MLCNSKNKRPDKKLNRILLLLAYSLIALSFFMISALLNSEHIIHILLLSFPVLFLCLYLGIRTIKASEEAMTYGGFANELVKNSNFMERIDNAKGEPIIQNNTAEMLFKNYNILEFIKATASNNQINKNAIYKLEQAVGSLIKTKVSIALDLNKNVSKIFETEEWFDIEVRPIYLRNENIFEKPYSVEKIKKETYLAWSLNNITARKTMETIFHEEKNYLHDFLDYLPVGIYTVDSKYEVEYCNHAFAKIVGLEREDVCKKNLKDLLTHNSKIPPKSPNWQGRIFIRKNDNSIVNCYISQENFIDKGNVKTRVVVFSQLPTEEDIQNQLNQSLNQLSWLFTTSPIGIVFINQDFDIIDSNSAAQKFFNLSEEKIAKENICSLIKNEYVSEFKQNIRSSNTPKKIDIEMMISDIPRATTCFITDMEDIYTSRTNLSKGWVIYLTDISEQKNLELQFAQAQKMQAMGQLAGGVAHDFNNLLTAMIGFSDLLLQRHGVGDPSFADLIQIKQNANRAAGLVRQLLAFSRKQPLQPELIDVTENFLELNHMLKRLLGENINIIFHHNDNLGFIKFDPVQFSQVIINLAVNAKDAMLNRGDLTIITETEFLSAPYNFGEDTIAPGEFVVIKVIDTGSGISTENLSRIFEPFFSTKQNVVGSGTGLGLSMVYGIVRQTGGFIKVESILKKGTTFSIYLPRFEKKEKIYKEREQSLITIKESIKPAMNLNQKVLLGMNVSKIDNRIDGSDFDATKYNILFVEDEASVRAFAVRALRKKGYNVVECSSAEDALTEIDTNQNFDLLITDMVMPGISGAELANIAKAKISDIKIILASGYSEEIARNELSNNTKDFEFMAKPFSLGDLTKNTFEILSKQ